MIRNLFHRQGFSYDYVFDWNAIKENQSKDSGYSTACDPVVGAAPKEAPSPAAGVAEETRERRHTGGNQSGGQEKHTHGPPPASPPPPVPGSQTHNKAHNVSKGSKSRGQPTVAIDIVQNTKPIPVPIIIPPSPDPGEEPYEFENCQQGPTIVLTACTPNDSTPPHTPAGFKGEVPSFNFITATPTPSVGRVTPERGGIGVGAGGDGLLNNNTICESKVMKQSRSDMEMENS